jgi:hypothetical protein
MFFTPNDGGGPLTGPSVGVGEMATALSVGLRGPERPTVNETLRHSLTMVSLVEESDYPLGMTADEPDSALISAMARDIWLHMAQENLDAHTSARALPSVKLEISGFDVEAQHPSYGEHFVQKWENVARTAFQSMARFKRQTQKD